MKRMACICIGLSIIAFAGYDLSSGAGETNLAGKHYWQVTGMTAENEPIRALLDLNAVPAGDGQYLCSGVFKVEQPRVFDNPTFGNWVRVQDQVRITLSTQARWFHEGGNYTVGISMHALMLDPKTLNGVSRSSDVYPADVDLYEFDCVYLGRDLPTDANP